MSNNMTLMIDDIDLPHFVFPTNQFYAPAIICESEPTRAGGKIRWIKQLKEIPFDLSCPDDVHCTGGLLGSLKTLGGADAETSTHILTLGTATYTVKLRLEESDWVSAKPIIEHCPQSDIDIYSGLTVKLAKVIT